MVTQQQNLHGNVSHVTNPWIGWFRMDLHDGYTPSAAMVESARARIRQAVQAAEDHGCGNSSLVHSELVSLARDGNAQADCEDFSGMIDTGYAMIEAARVHNRVCGY